MRSVSISSLLRYKGVGRGSVKARCRRFGDKALCRCKAWTHTVSDKDIHICLCREIHAERAAVLKFSPLLILSSVRSSRTFSHFEIICCSCAKCKRSYLDSGQYNYHCKWSASRDLHFPLLGCSHASVVKANSALHIAGCVCQKDKH